MKKQVFEDEKTGIEAKKQAFEDEKQALQ